MNSHNSRFNFLKVRFSGVKWFFRSSPLVPTSTSPNHSYTQTCHLTTLQSDARSRWKWMKRFLQLILLFSVARNSARVFSFDPFRLGLLPIIPEPNSSPASASSPVVLKWENRAVIKKTDGWRYRRPTAQYSGKSVLFCRVIENWNINIKWRLKPTPAEPDFTC
jgi:hypothetical protein